MTVSINHVAVHVTDLERSRAFYEKYFEAEAGRLYHNPRTGLRTYFLTFDGGARLELMTRPGTGPQSAPDALGWNHVALSVGSEQAVDALTARLAADGFTITSGPRTTGDGYYESVVLDPDGNQVEITV
ncbi:VOC family protein [Propionibacterium australiense]|uniref:Glyoxalase/Bleomycin resistance protein/Dioxygenase superfamily n=1 Tax=Propionibacterium australiense TaxID=119981 RepID=A0A383S8E3_9ACTN|nr:VOC family protein [Propionibacterium australiense]SYZ34187.1 Glyoxalase/Bleomycin resistance protein/Dioxygenase superfamily [Propionibacterium australiense]VEH89433.1 fosfomycin resistance protein FosB [Propionibacterium australiense]